MRPAHESRFGGMSTHERLWQELARYWTSARLQGKWTYPQLERALRDYRTVLGEIAYLEADWPACPWLPALRDLARALHWRLYQGHAAPSRLRLRLRWRYGIPAIFQRHRHLFVLSLYIFVVGLVFVLMGTLLDDRFALQFVPRDAYNLLKTGRTWLDDPTAFPPPALFSMVVIRNNVMVSVYLYVAGLTFGVGTFLILWQNILVLGGILGLGLKYGAFSSLVRFILAHGVLEISALLVETTAGFILARGLLRPGLVSRKTALSIYGLDSLYLFLGTLPWIVIAGLVEGYLSTRVMELSLTYRALVGTGLAGLLWLYLLAPVPAPYRSWFPRLQEPDDVQELEPGQWKRLLDLP